MVKLAVLISGKGSILEQIIQQQVPVGLVLADRVCSGLYFAASANIPIKIVSRSFGTKFNRERYTLDTIEVLKAHHIGLVAMAGYMTVFDRVMFGPYAERVINIHPSLLPSFKGDHAVRDALEFGVKVTGTTIHYATEKLDDGSIIAQEAVPVIDGDTVDTLHERIKHVERRLYPSVLRRLLATLPD